MKKALCIEVAKAMAGMLLLCMTMLPGQPVLARDNQTLAAEQPPAPEPHLNFKRSLTVKPFQGGQAYVEQHTVKPGEHLWKILREQYELSDSRIAFYCRIAKDVNQQVTDLNTLVPDQRILIPYNYVEQGAAGPAPEQQPGPDVAHVVKSGEHFGSIVRRHYRLPDHVLFNQKALQRFLQANPGVADVNVLEKGQTIIIPAALFEPPQPALVRAEPVQPAPAGSLGQQVPVSAAAGGDDRAAGAAVRDVLSMVTRSLEGTDNSSGSETIALPGRGALTLDLAQYPVYAFPGGKKIVLDIGSRLPRDVRQVIASSWQNTEVLAVHGRADMESIVDKVLDASGFYRVEKNGEYIVSRDNIQISVSGRWIVFKDKMLKNVVIVNLVSPEEKAVPAGFESYLAGIGLKIVDVRPGQAGAVRDQGAAEPAQAIAAVQQSGPDAPAVTDTILDTLGIACQKEYRTNIFQNVYSGVSLEVVVDRMFRKDGATYLIDFQSLPPKISDIMRQQGLRVLHLDPQQQGRLSIAQQVLGFCDVSYSGPPAKLEQIKGKKSNIKLMVPGLLLNAGGRSVLLTDIDLQPQIMQLIADFDIYIIKL